MDLIRDLVGRRRSKLTPFERQSPGAVRTPLSRKTRRLLQRQVDEVNKAQRLVRGREVNVYRIRDGMPSNDPSSAFASAWQVTVYALKGFVFSRVFDPSPEAPGRKDDVETDGVDVTKRSNARRKSLRCSPARRQSAILRKAEAWHGKHGATGFRQPLDAAELEAPIQEIPAGLSADYLQFTAQAEGLEVGDWAPHGLGRRLRGHPGRWGQPSDRRAPGPGRSGGSERLVTPALSLRFDGSDREPEAGLSATIESPA
jgi:hypothetical protein